MANSKESNGYFKSKKCDIVISGISGVFPESENVVEFAENLYSKRDLVTKDDRRWPDLPNVPHRTGKLKTLSKFDATFFGVHPKLAHLMDPMNRILLEKTFEAIVDAGVNPKSLRGTKTGVYVGVCMNEASKILFNDYVYKNDGSAMVGNSRSMFANRISYFFDFKGPSYSIDAACSSSMYAIEAAYKDITHGICDSAIVAGCNLCLCPSVSMTFYALGALSPHGSSKPFDERADGYTRSEGICVMLLQKRTDALRVYSRIVHAKTNCDGLKIEGITFPSSQLQQQLLTEFYTECAVDTSTVAWVEAHGTGTRAGDPPEAKALEAVYCPNRKAALKIGTVKSNMGHSEASSGVCSVTKVIIAMENGVIPPNANFETPRLCIDSLVEGRIQVISEPTKWDGGLVGVNSFGYGGANGHVLLESNKKDKVNHGLPSDDLPRLVALSGRTEEAVKEILTHLESVDVDAEFIRLFHEVYQDDIQGHLYRGYILLNKDKNKPVQKHVECYEGEKRPVWFMFSGMGSQWPGMAKSLMKFPQFAESIQKCHEVLKPLGVDLIHLVTEAGSESFDHPIHPFISITAIQIAFIDILGTIGIEADGFIGHSAGEMGCAYADGTLTLEQTILAAYYRGKSSLDADLIDGLMASIGVGYSEAKNMVPDEIDVACHNSSRNCTISGPRKNVQEFVSQLEKDGVFARVVNTMKIAYHSRYIKPASSFLRNSLDKVITNPKRRSEKWICTSVLESDWNKEDAKYCSATYLTNNLLNTVYFEESCAHIPSNAILIEIAPHGLMQAIVKRSLPETITNIPVTNRNEPDNLEFFFNSIGKMFENGLQPKIHKLYPEIKFPVSRGTPMIAPLIKWEHSEDWLVHKWKPMTDGSREVLVAVDEEEYNYISQHVIDKRNLFPATAYLMIAWETLTMMGGSIRYKNMSIVFEDVKFIRATHMPVEGPVSFRVTIQEHTGSFEISEGSSACVTGIIRKLVGDVNKELKTIKEPEDSAIDMNKEDIYKELWIRGYNYKGIFRSLVKCNNKGTRGLINWNDNYVAFMDSMMQLSIVGNDTRNLLVPTSIKKVVIDVKKHNEILKSLPEEQPKVVPVCVDTNLNVIQSGGIQIRGLQANSISRRKTESPVLEKYEFVPFVNKQPSVFEYVVQICLEIIIGSLSSNHFKIYEYIQKNSNEDFISNDLLVTLYKIPLIQPDITIFSGDVTSPDESIIVENKKLPLDRSALLTVIHDSSHSNLIINEAIDSTKDEGYILCVESKEGQINFSELPVNVLFDYVTDQNRFILLRKKSTIRRKLIPFKIDGQAWIEKLQNVISKFNSESNEQIIIYSENGELNGILGFYNCLKREIGIKNIRCFFIMDEKAPAFSIDDVFYKSQLEKDYAINVFKKGTWGTYSHLPLEKLESIKSDRAYASVQNIGDLSSFKWIEGPTDPYRYSKNPPGKSIKIVYSALNFRDVMMATGKISVDYAVKSRTMLDCVQGIEYSGFDSNGKRYMGLVPGASTATHLYSDIPFTWEIPPHWSLGDAATVPAVYLTCILALITSGKIQKGESILIHAGAGGIGQAAINIALYYECEIFVTVGTQEKRDFIRKHFPRIKESHIGNSRDTSFEEMILNETNGKGVDIVLNSLSEEKLQASIRCLGENGRFLEIGKFDLTRDNQIGMQPFLKGISFHGIMVDNYFVPEDDGKKWKLHDLFKQALSEGYVKPLIKTVFNKDQIEQAFRLMATGKHIGKIILKIRDEDSVYKPEKEPFLVDAVPRYLCYVDRSYIICGGLGGFGLELVDWMILRGARNVVISSRTGIKTGYQSYRISLWKSYGVNVVICTDDIMTKEGVINIIKKANQLAPVYGIFNLVAVLQDALFENQTEDTFSKATGPKVLTTYHLDLISRKICPRLEKFVVFSSLSCGRGTNGQTNYGMGNSVMERICENRKALGLPALAIQWGAIGDVGLVAQMAEENTDFMIGGTLQQQIQSCLQTLDYFLNQPNTIVSSMVVADKKSRTKATKINMIDSVLRILGLKDLKTISIHNTLAESGIDSLMAVEIKQVLESQFDTTLTTQDVRNLTFSKLLDMSTDNEENVKDSELVSKVDNLQGIRLLVNTLGKEEDLKSPLVKISSADDQNPSKKVVIIFPGIEGSASVMEPLAKNLNLDVYCVQYDYRNEVASVEELYQKLIPEISNLYKPHETYNVIGYSFGGLVAFEFVKYVESQGHNVKLWLIESSPAFMRILATSVLSRVTGNASEEIRVAIVQLYLENNYPKAISKFQEKLKSNELKTWREKIDYVWSFIPKDHQVFRKRYIEDITRTVSNRIEILCNHPDFKSKSFKSPVTLIRSKATVSLDQENKDDYDLSRYFLKPVKVHKKDGNHLSILENKETAEILMEEILK